MKKVWGLLVLFILFCGYAYCADTAPADPLPPGDFTSTNFTATPGEEETHFFSAFLNTMIMLGIILIAIFIASRLLKNMVNTRIQQQNTSSQIKIIEKRIISAKSTLYLVQVPGQQILIAESHGGVTNLALKEHKDHVENA
jgi:flagellar biogenesis protein FliO